MWSEEPEVYWLHHLWNRELSATSLISSYLSCNSTQRTAVVCNYCDIGLMGLLPQRNIETILPALPVTIWIKNVGAYTAVFGLYFQIAVQGTVSNGETLGRTLEIQTGHRAYIFNFCGRGDQKSGFPYSYPILGSETNFLLYVVTFVHYWQTRY